MYLPEFDYHRPTSLDEALALKCRDPEASWYAGGTELLAIMKLGLTNPSALIDLKGIPSLRMLEMAGGTLEIGGGVTHRTLERDPRMVEWLPILAQTAHQIANVRVRSVGTIGGNLAFAEPHSDPGPLLLALDASLTLVSRRGTRTIALDDFFVGPFETILDEDEIILSIKIPNLHQIQRSAQGRRAFRERPTANAVVLRTDSGYRVGIGAAGPVPVRARAAEALLNDCAGEPDALSDVAWGAGEAAAEASGAYAEPGASVEYKQQLVNVLIRRAVQELADAPTAESEGMPA